MLFGYQGMNDQNTSLRAKRGNIMTVTHDIEKTW